MHHRITTGLLFSILVCACAVDVRDDASLDGAPWRARLGTAPLEGEAQGADAAENQCGIVLREVGRRPNSTGGYESVCGEHGCFYVWSGTLDVAEEQLGQGATPHVLYQTSMGERAWWEIDAVEVDGAGAGYRRFAFRIDEHTPSPGMSTSSLNRTRIELVPFLRDSAGNRWFDHNRNANPFANYVLTIDNGWGINDDPSVCPARVAPDWMGNVVARISRDSSHACAGGAPLGDSVTYDGWARQRAAVRNVCFEVWEPGITDWNNPDQWRQLDVQAHYRFAPSGEWQSTWVNSVDHVGNNARYAFDLGGVDPFRPYQCPAGVPVETVPAPDGDRVRATLELRFTVNGAALAPSAAPAWRVVFEDYAAGGARDAWCAPQ